MIGLPAQRGFTLTEVLVALVVMAVGMLGIAGLYVEGLRASRTSIYRITAVTLADDMADRIRANPEAVVAYAGTGPGADNGCVNGVAICSPQALAEDDWFRWLRDIRARLPGGAAATIAVNAAPGAAGVNRYDITLSWPEVGSAEPVSYTMVVQR